MSYEINQVLPRSFGRLKNSESHISTLASQVRGVLASLLPRYGLLIGFLVFWQVSSTRGWVNPAIFPPLDVILSALWTNLANGALLDDIAISLQRSGTAFAFAVVIGIPLGLFMARFVRSNRRSIRSCSSSARPRRWRSTRSSSCCLASAKHRRSS